MGENILSLLITGAIPNASTELLWSSGIEFYGSFYTACAFAITDYGRYFEPKDHGLAQAALENVVVETCREVSLTYSTAVEDTLYLFTGLHNATQYSSLFNAIKSAHRFLKRNFDISFVCCVGRAFEDFNDLIADLPMLRRFMRYMADTGDTSIVRAAPFVSFDWEKRPEGFFFEKIPRLHTLIRVQNYDEAYDVLCKIVTEYSTPSPSPAADKYRLHTLILLLLEGMENALVEYAKGRRDLLASIRKIEFCRRIEDLPQAVLPLFGTLKEILQANRIENTDDAILYYLSRNISDSDMSVSSVAEHFEISIATLNRHMLKKTGASAADCIRFMRYEAAKELIDRDELSLDEIAAAIGLTDRRMLGRLFMKFEGQTPSEYRKNRARN